MTVPILVLPLFLWSYEATFGAFVCSAEFATFAVAFDLDVAAAGTHEFRGFRAWWDGLAAACACD